MPRSPSPRIAALAVAASLALPFRSAPARAESVAAELENRNCGTWSLEVSRWTPAKGPAARFVAADDSGFIALGRTDEGFWSVQRTELSDACDSDECTETHLVFTRFDDGKSKRYPLFVGSDVERYTKGADVSAPGWAEAKADWKRDLVVRRMWHYAGTVWPAKQMRHDYGLATPRSRRGESGELLSHARYTGWLVGVVQGGDVRVRYTIDHRSTMCWCSSSWRSFVPKKA